MPTEIATRALTKEEARRLTDRIRSTAEDLCNQLREAYEGSAHVALGYASWEEYVTSEFDISRTYSYRLLAQAKVIEALETASGLERLSPKSDIREIAAREILPDLPFVVDDVERRVAGGQEPRAAVREAVESARSEVQAKRNGTAKAPPVVEPEPDDEHAPDLVEELATADAEIRRLQELVDSLSKSDEAREIVTWSAKYAQLNARLQQAITTGNESARQAKAYGTTLSRVRAALGVEKNSEIVAAIEALKR